MNKELLKSEYWDKIGPADYGPILQDYNIINYTCENYYWKRVKRLQTIQKFNTYSHDKAKNKLVEKSKKITVTDAKKINQRITAETNNMKIIEANYYWQRLGALDDDTYCELLSEIYKNCKGTGRQPYSNVNALELEIELEIEQIEAGFYN